MDYPKFIVSNQKEESISIERVKHACAAIWEPEPLDFRKLSFPSHLGKYYIKIGKISAKIHDTLYEGCSNMNASGFITFFTYMLQQNDKRYYEGLYVTFKLAPGIKKNTVYLSSYSPLNESHVSILTNPMLRTYTSDIDERIIHW